MTKTEIQNLLREHGVIDTAWRLTDTDQLLISVNGWDEHERMVKLVRSLPVLEAQIVTTGSLLMGGYRFTYVNFKMDDAPRFNIGDRVTIIATGKTFTVEQVYWVDADGWRYLSSAENASAYQRDLKKVEAGDEQV